MQDPSFYSSQIIKAHQVRLVQQQQHQSPQFPEQEHLKCPRCDSTNTKFCYYNNYNLSQPRHYCKSCRRYWTKGGALRNIPVGGGSRKNGKRSSGAGEAVTSTSKRPATAVAVESKKKIGGGEAPSLLVLKGETASCGGHFGNLLDTGGGFGDLIGASAEGHFGHFLHGLGVGGGESFVECGSGQNVDPSGNSNNNDISSVIFTSR